MCVCVFIFVIKQQPNPTIEGLSCTNAKKRTRRAKKWKGIKAQRVKPHTPTRARTEQNTEERTQRKKQSRGILKDLMEVN